MAKESGLERRMNALTDMDWGWWPFLALRPAKVQQISLARLGVMSLAFGTVLGGAVLGLIAFTGRIPWRAVPTGIGACVIFFFVVWGAVFLPLWNRRADRLRNAR